MLPIRSDAWAPREAIRPGSHRSTAGGHVVESNGSPGCYGGWELTFDLDPSSDPVVASVDAAWTDVERGWESVEARAEWLDDEGVAQSWAPLEVTSAGARSGLLRTRPMDRVPGCRLVLRLLLRWSSTGSVEWTSAECTTAPRPGNRRLRLGAASSQARGEVTTLDANCERYVEVCDEAGRAGVDLLCLPETILTNGLPQVSGERLLEHAVEVPGERVRPFMDVARRHAMAIGFSVLERADDLVFNTAVLIDSDGRLALKYRKVHLAVREAWRGVTPGHEFSVAEVGAGLARVGMNVCMDSSSAESARTVARLGAEILLLPIDNDFRATQWNRFEDRSRRFSLPRWTVIQQARAMDNHLHVVAARITGVGSGIFGPDGSVLAMDYGDSPLVTADVDLNDLRSHPTGPPYKDVIRFQQRESVYSELVDGSGQDLAPVPQGWT